MKSRLRTVPFCTVW